MKNKLVIIIVGVLGLVLVFIGVGFVFLKSIGYVKKDLQKQLRKIQEEEISHENANEIMEFYISNEDELKEEKITKTLLIASDENGEYIVRVELESNPGEYKQTTMNYLGDGKWKVNFPLEDSSNYDEDKYTMSWPEDIELD